MLGASGEIFKVMFRHRSVPVCLQSVVGDGFVARWIAKLRCK